MASAGAGNGAAVDISRKFVVGEALTRLGGSVARYDVKVLAGGYQTYVEADVPAPPGPAAAEVGRPVFVRCAGGVSRELGESEESGAGAFLGALRCLFGARVDEAELRRALDEKKRMGSLRYEHIMTFDVPALTVRSAGEMCTLCDGVTEAISKL